MEIETKQNLELQLIQLKSKALNKFNEKVVKIQERKGICDRFMIGDRFYEVYDSDADVQFGDRDDNRCTKVKKDGTVCGVISTGYKIIETENRDNAFKDKRPKRCIKHKYTQKENNEYISQIRIKHKYTQKENNEYISQIRIKHIIEEDEHKAKCDEQINKLREVLKQELKDLEEKYEKEIQTNKLNQAPEEVKQQHHQHHQHQQYLYNLPNDLAIQNNQFSPERRLEVQLDILDRCHVQCIEN